jgi:hypothetical protein
MSQKLLLGMAGIVASSVSNAMVINPKWSSKHKALFAAALSITGFIVVWLGVS